MKEKDIDVGDVFCNHDPSLGDIDRQLLQEVLSPDHASSMPHHRSALSIIALSGQQRHPARGGVTPYLSAAPAGVHLGTFGAASVVEPGMRTDIPPDLAQAALTEIGRVVACGGWLELQVSALLSSLDQSKDSGASFSQLITKPASSIAKALAAVADRHPDPDAVRALAADVAGLLPRRNEVVHAQWGKGPRGASAALRFKPNSDLELLTMRHADLNRLASELHGAAVRAMQLIPTEGPMPAASNS